MRAMRDEFEKMLRSTSRDGVEDCLDELNNLGFFEAPASTRFHLNYEGGLMEHSMNVAKTALRLREQMIDMDASLKPYLPEDSVIIASLLHDVCKADIYKPTIKRVKKPDGSFADEPGYDVDFTNFPMGHGEKSVVVLLLSGLALTNDEMLSIRWHMANRALPKGRCPAVVAITKPPLLTVQARIGRATTARVALRLPTTTRAAAVRITTCRPS